MGASSIINTGLLAPLIMLAGLEYLFSCVASKLCCHEPAILVNTTYNIRP